MVLTNKIILDSGAFSAHVKGETLDVEQYAEFVKEYGASFEGGCFNLDVIGDGKASYDNWKKLRSLGVDTIPVFHLGTDEKYLHKYLKQTDYIGIGAIANLDTKARLMGLDWVWNTHLTNSDGTPKLKVHGLGLTSVRIMLRYPWYSVDSSTATKTAMFGKIHVPELKYIASEKRYEPNYDYIFALLVSDQGNHHMSNSRSFFSMPPTMQKGYRAFIEERGYEVGNISGRVIKTTRRHKRRVKGASERDAILQPSFDKLMISPNANNTAEGAESTTVAGSWEQRCLFNLDFWKELVAKHGRDTIVYHVASSTSHLDAIGERQLPMLVSYYLLKNKGILFRKIVLGEDE